MTRYIFLLLGVVTGLVLPSWGRANEQGAALQQPVFFIVHSEVEIAANPEEIWPFLLDIGSWRVLPPSRLVSGSRGEVGEKTLVSAGTPEQAFDYYVETLELDPNVRRVMLIYSDEHRQGDIGYLTWTLQDLGDRTKASYDVYAVTRSSTMSEEEARAASRLQTAENQGRMDADFLTLKRLVEDGHTPASARLGTLMDDVWQHRLAHSTAMKRQNGVPVESFEDFTLEAYRERLNQTAAMRARLQGIDRDALDDDRQLDYDILSFELRDNGANDTDYWLTLDLTAYQAPYILGSAEQVLGALPISTSTDAEKYLALLGEYADSLDQIYAKVVAQAERGIRVPRQALPTTRDIWRGRIAVAERRRAALAERVTELAEDERERLISQADLLESERVVPAIEKLLELIGPAYEENAPTEVGLGSLPGGGEVYERLVYGYTSMEMTPDEIHELGLQRVEELAGKMAAIRSELGFEGTAREFHEQLRTDPRFVPSSPGEIEERFMKSIRIVEPQLDSMFRLLPKAPYAVERLPAAFEAGMTFGYYSPPSPSDPAGTYFYNGGNLSERNMINSAALILHELLPGHHFHLALQKENEGLHPLRRNYQLTAYTEGWAEYAGHLGHELGAYDDPYDRYGRYVAEMFLAIRLVADTGMNSKGWSLDRTRSLMREHAYNSDLEIETETLRYSTSIPGQALAYRLGMEKILQLREMAERELGDRFDVRDFHDVVLGDGGLPLVVLDAKVRRYIERVQSQHM